MYCFINTLTHPKRKLAVDEQLEGKSSANRPYKIQKTLWDSEWELEGQMYQRPNWNQRQHCL